MKFDNKLVLEQIILENLFEQTNNKTPIGDNTTVPTVPTKLMNCDEVEAVGYGKKGLRKVCEGEKAISVWEANEQMERDGISRTWYENGQLKWEDNYKDGKRDGRNRTWDENGNLSYDLYYINDEEVSKEKYEKLRGKTNTETDTETSEETPEDFEKLRGKTNTETDTETSEETPEDFEIIPWIDAKLNNKATFYTNKLNETGRVTNLTSGWINGFTVTTKHKEDPWKESFVDQIRQDLKYGENSEFSFGDYIYIYFTKQFKQIVQKVVGRHIVDVVILPRDKVSSKKVVKQKTKEVDREAEFFAELPTLTITDSAGKTHEYSGEYIWKQRYEEHKSASKIQQQLENKHGIKFNDDQLADLTDITSTQKDEEEVKIIASLTPMSKIGQSKYMSFKQFNDGLYINENSVNIKQHVMNDQKEPWKSPEYKNKELGKRQWTRPEPVKTPRVIQTEWESFDDEIMTMTGDMVSNYSVAVKTAGFNTKYTQPTDPDIIKQIGDLNLKLIDLVIQLKTEYAKSGDANSALYKLMAPARSWGANIESGEGFGGYIPTWLGGDLGINFGDSEKLAGKLFNTWWGEMIKPYNNKQSEAAPEVTNNLIIRYNERVLTKLWEWTMSQIENGKNDTYKAQFLKINSDGTWDSYTTYEFPWKSI